MPNDNPMCSALAVANNAKSEGTIILPVFISGQNDTEQLEYMSSLGNDGRVFEVTAFD